MKMQKQSSAESSVTAAATAALSPTSKRRAEFTIKQLQLGMMGRARSKLNDVLRPRSETLPNRIESSTIKPSAKTFEFLSIWASRHKKPAAATTATTLNKSNENAKPEQALLSAPISTTVTTTDDGSNKVTTGSSERVRRVNNIKKLTRRNSSLDLTLLQQREESPPSSLRIEENDVLLRNRRNSSWELPNDGAKSKLLQRQNASVQSDDEAIVVAATIKMGGTAAYLQVKDDSLDGSGGTETKARSKPRKKLSFREPPVEGNSADSKMGGVPKMMPVNKSETLPRAKKWLYDNDETTSSSLDFQLEVKY